MKKIYMLTIIAFLVSCGPGVGDVSEELGNGYIYIGEGAQRRIISGTPFTKGIVPNVTSYKFNNSFVVATQEPDTAFIIPFIIEDIRSSYGFYLYKKDSGRDWESFRTNFEQSFLWQDTLVKRIAIDNILPGNDFKDLNELEIAARIVMHGDPIYRKMITNTINYYIINKELYKLNGPFTKEEYDIERIRLKVPESLKLDEKRD